MLLNLLSFLMYIALITACCTIRNNKNALRLLLRMAKKSEVWRDTDEDDMDSHVSSRHCCNQLMSELKVSMKSNWNIFVSHPYIAIITIVFFAVLCTASIAMTFTFAEQYGHNRKFLASEISRETATWFRDQLNAAVFPLFSLGELVKELPYFQDLPFEIGPGGAPGSAPYRQDTVITHRNTSGICDDPTVVDDFNRIAKNIKEGANMNGALVNLQLAPEGVVCLLYPMNNTEDFEPPLYLDNSGTVGLDLLKDPECRAISEAAVPASGIVVAGPMTLRQCRTCPPAVSRAFIAQMPIHMPPELGYNITVDGKRFSTWGFAVALINWDRLVDRSDIQQRYRLHGMQFVLSTTDIILNASMNEYVTKVGASSLDGFPSCRLLVLRTIPLLGSFF